jgi:hypothetical protein
MNSKPSLRAAAAACLSVIIVVTAAVAAPDDYEFQLVEKQIQQSVDATIAVRLIDRRTGRPVENAVVFATRMDMAPEGMETMTTPVEAMPSTEPGVYNFKSNLVMAGGWRFSIAAKVQGESETIESRLEFKAVE